MDNVQGAGAKPDPQSGLISQSSAVITAFVLTRATMAAVIVGSLFLGGFEEQRSALFFVQVVVAGASVVALGLSAYALVQTLRKQPPTSLHPWILIALDSILAIGVLTVIDVDSSPLAWVALITPVLETAVFFSISRAAFVWFGLSLAFLGLRLTLSVSDDAATETLIRSFQQVLATLFVSGPAALMADSAQDRIQSLADARRSSDETADRLRRIAESARQMSMQQSLGDILSLTCESAASIGFDQSDVVVRNSTGQWTVHSSNSNGPAANVPPEILSETLEDGVDSIYVDSPIHGEELVVAGVRSGHAIELGADQHSGQSTAVLRVWAKNNAVSTEDLRALALLGGHTREAYRAAELLQEAQAHADRLLYEVRHDGLTGLANRSFVLETLTQRLDAGKPLALFFIDLDGFKGLNDTLGHQAGDDALVTVADRLRLNGREGSLAGRMGGDEFVVLVPTAASETIESLIGFGDQIVRVISEPMVAAGQHAQLGASVGVAIHDGRISPDQLVSLADDAMYTAKRQGGGVHMSPTALALYGQRNAA